MTLSFDHLERIFGFLKNEAGIRSACIHTKTIGYSPSVYGRPGKLQLLAVAGVRLVFHLAPPYQVCEVARRAIRSIQAAAIRCYNQLPLL